MKKIALVSGLLSVVAISAQAEVLEARTLTRDVDGVVVTGYLLSGLVGVNPEDIRVYAERGGNLRPVPFQVDELTPDRNSFILPEGPRPNTDLSDGVFSIQDEIAFMAHDLGGKVDRGSWPHGFEGAAELEVIDPLNAERAWAYIFSFADPPPRSSEDYVVWDDDAEEVRTRYYINGYPPRENKIYFSRAMSRPPCGTGVDYIDRMKLRFHFISRGGLIQFKGNEEMAGADILNAKDGPIRVFRKGQVYYELPFGYKYNAGGTLQIFWERFGQGPVELDMLPGVRLVLRRAWMISSTDFTPEAYGMKFYTSNNPEGVMVDGRMSEAEKNLDLHDLAWQGVTGEQGTMIQRAPTNIPRMNWEDAFVYYIDDAERPDPPEEHPGMIGCLVNKLDLSLLPRGLWRSAALFYAPPPNFPAERVSEYLNIEDHPLVLKVGEKWGRSNILPWHPVLAHDYFKNYKPLPGEIDLKKTNRR
jgi:hypothetical protein